MTATRVKLPVVPRQDFVRQFGRAYRPAHLTMLGPTGRGKTTLGFQLAKVCANPNDPIVVFAGKPPGRDPVMNFAAEDLNLRIIEQWPPSRLERRLGDRRGWLLRPYQPMDDLETADKNIYEQFRNGLRGLYAAQSPHIVFIDEAYHVQHDLKLEKECNAILTRGMPDIAMWSLIQRGRFVSYHTYSAPEHLFIFNEPNRADRQRYGEIGGVDPEIIESFAEGLRTDRAKDGRTISEVLYIRRSGPEMCIVGMN